MLILIFIMLYCHIFRGIESWAPIFGSKSDESFRLPNSNVENQNVGKVEPAVGSQDWVQETMSRKPSLMHFSDACGEYTKSALFCFVVWVVPS